VLCTEFNRLSASKSSTSLEVDEVDNGYILLLNLYNKQNWKKMPLVISSLSGSTRPTKSILLFFRKNRLLVTHELYQQTYCFLRK